VPRVIITEDAANGMRRCYQFLVDKSEAAARRAGQAIDKALSLLETLPEIGRPFADTIDLRELIIRFGSSGYIALYRYEPHEERVYIVAFRHLKEVNYSPYQLQSTTLHGI